jgi:hypothetical protein
MAVGKPVPVPQKEITSIDVVSFAAGLNLNGAQNAPSNSFVDSKDVELSIDGYLQPRRVLTAFLPDTVQTSYQKYPVRWNGLMYYFTADNGKIKFCQEGATTWTDCGGGSNSFTTNAGGKCKFLRVLDNVLILNGGNGDKLAYVDLSTGGFPVVKYTAITDPTTALTNALTNLAAGAFNIYYAYSYTGPVGETKLSNIATISINRVRDQWQSAASPGSIKLTRPAAPAGSKFWNLYIAVAATGGTIQSSDMLQLATGLDLATTDFVDDGSLSINLGSIAPLANSTDGPKVGQGIVEDGNPILFSDPDHPQAIYIGGGGPYAMDFSIANGGYKAEPEKGTNFVPTAIIGFRNGQGVPSLTVLYSNTEGLSKQSVLEQQTVNYGDQSFTVWGVTEQHYGAAGVAATDSAINYNGKLLFLSTDGFMSMNTQPLRQNVISTDPISVQNIDKYVRRIKNSAMTAVVGAGWDNKFIWTVPNDGFDTPQQLLVTDDNNRIGDLSAWYTLNIPAQWIGVVSPVDSEAFIYVCDGVHSYKLVQGDGTFDTKNGVSVPFGTSATGPLIPVNGSKAHNTWQATVQAVFYVRGLVGDITVGVTYRDQNGKSKVKSKTYHGPTFTPSSAGGWGDTGWTYGRFPAVPWRSMPAIDATAAAAVTAVDVRIKVPIDDIANEIQWFYSTPVGYGAYQMRAISYEGVNLGVRPDLQ